MSTKQVRRLIVGISGASGAIYGIRVLELLRDKADIETHLIISQAGKLTIGIETDRTVDEVETLADVSHNYRNVAAPISSGSFDIDAMIVAPCSMKTLSAIVNSYSDNLLTRSADVTLKEGRPLILMPRESPLHVGHTRLLHEAAKMGVHLCPPVPAFYNSPQTVDELVDHSVGRALDLLGIDVKIVDRWTGHRGHSED
ncbi:MAG: UbiX family flavin prenyltransferase [Acidimicrobiales bacterium]